MKKDDYLHLTCLWHEMAASSPESSTSGGGHSPPITRANLSVVQSEWNKTEWVWVIRMRFNSTELDGVVTGNDELLVCPRLYNKYMLSFSTLLFLYAMHMVIFFAPTHVLLLLFLFTCWFIGCCQLNSRVSTNLLALGYRTRSRCIL